METQTLMFSPVVHHVIRPCRDAQLPCVCVLHRVYSIVNVKGCDTL